MFDSVVINGAGGRRLTMSAPGAGPTTEYVATATLGHRPVHATWLTNEELTSGQTLTYTLSPTPTDWATGAGAAPPSLSDRHRAGSKKH